MSWGTYPPSRCGISDLYHMTASTIKGPPLATIQSTMQTAKKNKTMPNFAVVKELVEQHVDSYRYSRASLAQALPIRRPFLELQARLG